uniref:Uncharacterized protein n=1 Tax=Anguilla anguilla TaxID=7936 RepID=A0A0E9QI60_ANGAN
MATADKKYIPQMQQILTG